MRSKILTFGGLIFICLSVSACMHVNPWERQYLARPEMALNPDPLETKMSDHVDQSKEASTSVNAGSGDGCGCY